MKLPRIFITLIVAFQTFTIIHAASIADIASQFHQGQISVDSLFNYINAPTHANEVYWWSLHNFEKNDPMGNYVLGRCFFTGIGTTIDETQAIGLFERAAGQGVDEALVDLGRMYQNGWGVKKDAAKAKQFLQEAVAKKVPRGFNALGWWFFNEEKDNIKALSYFQKSADAGYPGGTADVGYMYEYGYGVDKDIAKALKMYLKAADAGNAIGLCNAGYFYEQGIGTDENHETALQFYLLSASKGNARAAYKVGFLKQYGNINQDINYNDISKWYAQSAQKDYIPAKIEFAFLLLDGLGVPQNQERAMEVLEEVGPQNVGAWGACRVAEYLSKKNPARALVWAKAAYDKADEYVSSAESAKLLGFLYLKGGKEIFDYELAVKFLKEGAEMDQPDCVEMMKALGEPFEEQEPTISSGVR